MQYTYENLTLNIETLDHEFQGDCRFDIPFSHKEFLKDCCGMERYRNNLLSEYDPVFEHSYGVVYVDTDNMNYWSDSADLLIAYMSWLIGSDKPQSIDVGYSHPYWAIHDVQHAINDESGCTIYVSADIERERLLEAFELMKGLNHFPDYEMITEIQEDFQQRFNETINLEKYLYPEEIY